MGEIALGSVQFGLDYGVTRTGVRVSELEVKKILRLAKKNSIDLIDTAFAYGKSESILGAAGGNKFQLVTKTATLNYGVDRVLQNFEASLKKLKVEGVYGLLIHDINDLHHKSFDSLFSALSQLKNEGLIAKVGFSTYTPAEVDFLLHNFDFDLIQLPFNVFDRRLTEGGQLKLLSKKCVEVHARSIFLQGILLASAKDRHPFFKKWCSLFRSWDHWLEYQRCTNLQAALGFVLAEELIHKVVVGVDSADQLLEIVDASKLSTPGIPIDISTADESLLNPSLWDI